MTQKFTPLQRDKEKLANMSETLETLREYDDTRLADCVAAIAEIPQDIGVLTRAIAIVGAERICNKHHPTERQAETLAGLIDSARNQTE